MIEQMPKITEKRLLTTLVMVSCRRDDGKDSPKVRHGYIAFREKVQYRNKRKTPRVREAQRYGKKR